MIFWDDRVAEWVARQIPGIERGFGPCRAMGVADGETFVAGVVFHNWYPETGVIELSAAALSRRWLTRPVLRAMFGYPFEDLGCQAVVSRNDPDATHLHRMWRAVGATQHEIPHLRGRGRAEVVMVLTSDAWKRSRFMRCSHG